ncbi:hypothetical protein BGW36DRAFT_462267 [Talaromyces proteolyticus]|uniref:Kinesin light chain n=1 Tax=Talaromyces proteolyticus TaxID=1131652 RepID=A0AAD4KPM9_9EURO|nr:uncharacterized protein BGW36DRAFT_462267 [Talaromyces proteolyticus]KAH8696391.1 hypothetical protein BGW36DRAFT_462267 [Talaromyces proteolyticus]
MTSLTHNDYTIAWICALPLEVAAARVMLHETLSPLPKPSTDPNAYELGESNGHYIHGEPGINLFMANLVSTFWNQGRWTEAEKLGVQVMEKMKMVLGDEHPDTLAIMANLAYTLKSQGILQHALTLMKKCSNLRNTVLGPGHPDSMSSSRALSDWMDEYNTLLDQTPLTGKNSAHEEHVNLPYARRRSAATLFLGNHPLIIAARTPSPLPDCQDLQDVD